MVSLEREDQTGVVEGLKSVSLMIGYERFVLELLPLLKYYSAFYEKKMIIDLINNMVIIEFEFKKDKVFEEVLDFFSFFTGLEDFEIRETAFKRLCYALSLQNNERVLKNILWKLFADESKFKRQTIFRIIKSDSISSEITNDQDFMCSFFSKLLEEKNDIFKKQAVKCLVHVLHKKSNAFSQQFLQEAINNLFKDPNYFVTQHAIDLALCISDSILFENYFKKIFKMKNFYVSKHLFDKIKLCKEKMPSLITDDFYDSFTNYLYEQDVDLRNMSFSVLPQIVECSNEVFITKKLLNCVKNIIASNLNKEFRYLMILSLLKCCKILSNELLTDIVLKPLLNFIREDGELADSNFISNLFFFLLKIGYDVVKEGFAPFFKSILASNSQHVS
jgi:hypothetical protein